MFIPIGDENSLKSIRFQYMTVALIALNVAVFLFQTVANVDEAVLSSFAVVPSQLFRAGLLSGAGGDLVTVPERATLVSYMFLHGDVMHLGVNMLFLWVFGDNIEDALGHFRFLAFYLACGIAAALLHAVMLPESRDALIGASGAVSGVIAAYLLLHPRVSVWVLALKIIPLRITAVWALGAWIAFQFFMIVLPSEPEAVATAWWAHIGGILAGAVLIPIMRRRSVALPDR